jgi:diguanylate cyclase (GGDEF)-like protein
LKYFAAFIFTFTASIILNIFFGFYFKITAETKYILGSLYWLKVAINAVPVILILININMFRPFQIYLFIIFVIINISGIIIDIFIPESSLIWQFFILGILIMYFYIIQYDSLIDVLTKLNNHYSFNIYIKTIMQQKIKSNFFIVMIDIDSLKKINESFGRIEGDITLCDIAKLINECARNIDFLARYKGDKFTVVIKEKVEIENLFNRIKGALEIFNNRDGKQYKVYLNYVYDEFDIKKYKSFKKFIYNIEKLLNTKKYENQKLRYMEG